MFICAENETLSYCSWLQLLRWKVFKVGLTLITKERQHCSVVKSVFLESYKNSILNTDTFLPPASLIYSANKMPIKSHDEQNLFYSFNLGQFLISILYCSVFQCYIIVQAYTDIIQILPKCEGFFTDTNYVQIHEMGIILSCCH